jgi:hypothetical protein
LGYEIGNRGLHGYPFATTGCHQSLASPLSPSMLHVFEGL